MYGVTIVDCHFGHDAVAVKDYTIVSWFGLFVAVTERGLVEAIIQTVAEIAVFDREGHDEKVAIVAATCSAKMSVAETVDGVIAIVVAATSVPAFKPSVGANLYHAEG